MPERVELGVRGRKRRWMTVAEADDRDPAEQVEVALSVRVDEPRSLAGDEGDVGARVGGEQRG